MENKDKKLFLEFTNNVFCRRDSNQIKAKKIWEQIKNKLPKKVASEFNIDWYHYLNNSLDHNGFEIAINELKEYYL